jgi:hypothetical protein
LHEDTISFKGFSLHPKNGTKGMWPMILYPYQVE